MAFNYRPRSGKIIELVASVRLSVCLFVRALPAEQQRAIGVITSLQVFVCVSVISGRMRIIARRRSIGFYLIIFLPECMSINRAYTSQRDLNIDEK